MEIKIIIDYCGQCRHMSHSGLFTPGGAKNICSHPEVSPLVKKYKKWLEFKDANDPETDITNQAYYWTHRIVEGNGKIPEWCPLKNGFSY